MGVSENTGTLRGFCSILGIKGVPLFREMGVSEKNRVACFTRSALRILFCFRVSGGSNVGACVLRVLRAHLDLV